MSEATWSGSEARTFQKLTIQTNCGLSVCRLVCHDSEPYKNGWTDQDAVWDVNSGSSKEPCIRWGPSHVGPGAVTKWVSKYVSDEFVKHENQNRPSPFPSQMS